MESIREIYKIGYGPSSSHTMGPRFATKLFLKDFSNANSYRVELFGSLAATGKGHLTNVAIEDVFKKIKKDVEIIWRADDFKDYHSNALTFYAYDENKKILGHKTYYSVGGGSIEVEGEKNQEKIEIYDNRFDTLEKILKYCDSEGLQLWEFVLSKEDSSIVDYIEEEYNISEEDV